MTKRGVAIPASDIQRKAKVIGCEIEDLLESRWTKTANDTRDTIWI